MNIIIVNIVRSKSFAIKERDKLGDLQEICHKLKINSKDINGKNLKKTLLYEEILIKLKEDSINNIS